MCICVLLSFYDLTDLMNSEDYNIAFPSMQFEYEISFSNAP